MTVRPTCQLVPGGSGPARGASSPPSSEGKLERDRDREGGEGGRRRWRLLGEEKGSYDGRKARPTSQSVVRMQTT